MYSRAAAAERCDAALGRQLRGRKVEDDDISPFPASRNLVSTLSVKITLYVEDDRLIPCYFDTGGQTVVLWAGGEVAVRLRQCG